MRQVICYETGEVFESATAAVRSIGLKSVKSIITAIKNNGTAGGYHWYYADEPKPDPATFRNRSKRFQRPVICYETGERFESLTEAANRIGANADAIWIAINQRIKAGDYHWYYADEPRPKQNYFKNLAKRPVRCIETGKVFESTADAGRHIGRQRGGISDAISRNGTCGGYHWEYADNRRDENKIKDQIIKQLRKELAKAKRELASLNEETKSCDQ